MAKDIFIGAGRKVNVTTTPQVVWAGAEDEHVYRAHNVSVMNTGATEIRFQKVDDVADFTVADGLIVPAETEYNSYSLQNEDKQRQIKAIVVATESGTSTAVVNFE